jgi:hypothetical protein
MSRSSASRGLVVIDDLQSAPHLAADVLSFWTLLRPDADLLVIGWPDAVHLLSEAIPRDARLRLDGTLTVRQIAHSLKAPWEIRQEILGLAAGDALVADLAAGMYKSNGRVGSPAEIAALAYASVAGDLPLEGDQARTLYAIACLATFEIDVLPQFLQGAYRSGVSDLLEAGLLRRRPPFVYLGHKSLARLVVGHLRNAAPWSSSAMPPAAVAVEYLRVAGPDQIKQTLDRLDLVSVSGDDDQFGAAFLAHSWTSLRVLVRFLSQEARKDPTWGDNVASAVFAGEAFAALNLVDDWQRTAEYVRGRWSVDNTEELPTTMSETAEADDFLAISEAMREEDALDPPPAGAEADSIDLERFHRTWVLGLLLGFEGTALHVETRRRDALLTIASNMQLPSGAFYPERVPWVTDRVLLGLASLGEGVHASDVAQAAATWLRTRRPVGPYSFGVWRPGTGRWNTELQTTAMTLLALGRAGVPPSDNSVRRGITYLRDGRAEWYRPGKEIDCSQAIEAALVLGGSWRDFSQEIRSLLSWAQDVKAWSAVHAKASEVQDESSKVSAVASALIGIIWETVREELPILFEGVAGLIRDIDSEVAPEAEPASISLPRPAWVGPAEDALRRCVGRCEEYVREREALVARGGSSTEVQDRLAEWRALKRQGQSILGVLGDARMTPRDLAERLDDVNAYGRRVYGAAWENIS